MLQLDGDIEANCSAGINSSKGSWSDFNSSPVLCFIYARWIGRYAHGGPKSPLDECARNIDGIKFRWLC